MDTTTWPELGGKEVRHRGEVWELTGEVAVEDDGTSLAAEAVARDDVRHETGTLHFSLQDGPDALNPGDLGDHFDRIERTKREQYLVVETEGRTYRYRLERFEPS